MLPCVVWSFMGMVRQYLGEKGGDSEALEVSPGHPTGGTRRSRPPRHPPVVIGFERPVFVESQVLGLIVRQLRQVGVERGQVQAGNVLVWGGKEGIWGL